jgi:hypothetical protein
MDLSSFIKENCRPLFEGVRSRDIDKAIKLMSSYLSKRKIYTVPQTYAVSVDNKNKLAVYMFNEKSEGALFIWDLAATAQVEAVLFTKDFNNAFATSFYPDSQQHTYDVYAEAKGANTVQMMKLVEAVLTGKVAMTTAAVSAHIRDAQLFESVIFTENSIHVNEDKDPHLAELERKKGNLYQRLRDAKKKGKDTEGLQAEYDKLVAELAEARVSVRGSVTVNAATDKDVESINTMFEDEERATPEERFDDMKNYIYNVIKGIRPLALLCGAPGVGKTYRVMQAVKGSGLEQNRDYKLLKGKCTPAALYMALHDFKNKGQLIIMDDCDSVFKDPDAINLLKAAFDSSDERWVTWGISTPIPMPTEIAEMCDDAVWDEVKGKWYYPKEFLYEAGGLVITNYNAGQIDTAVRNRALICDLSFTTNEILSLIRGLAPKIMAGVISEGAKMKALDYLQELADKKAPVELSIRSFTLCAGLYDSDAPERSVKRMINEQMRLQFARGGKKY